MSRRPRHTSGGRPLAGLVVFLLSALGGAVGLVSCINLVAPNPVAVRRVEPPRAHRDTPSIFHQIWRSPTGPALPSSETRP